MPYIELDTFYITLKIPKDQPVSTIRRILNRPNFHDQLRKAVESVLKQYRPLKSLAVTLSR